MCGTVVTLFSFFFFFQAEDGIRDLTVTGVQTCALPISSGIHREYLLHVPESYDRARPTPLVISMHGAMNWPAFQKNLSRWNETADANGFIVVYPSGTGTGPKTWFMRGSQTPSRMPDVMFISAL